MESFIAEYRCKWLNDLGYVVYRHFSDLKCTDEQQARTHQTAIFVCESEGVDYCAYRNEMMLKHGTDDVKNIRG